MKPGNLMVTFLIMMFVTNFNHGQILPKVTSGTIIRHADFPSRFVQSRHIDVWLPDDYDRTKHLHDVIYMHDGQMLFDSSFTWNHQSWEADKTMANLRQTGAIRPSIIVAIWNVPERRYADYFPQKILKYIPQPTLQNIISKQIIQNPDADNYLAFIVSELKPYIDSTYRVQTDANHTFLMGSSMGGLISLYGLCEYPDIFGGAACLSIHSPLAAYHIINENTERHVASKFRDYLYANLPEANTKKIYLDYGDQSGDAFYQPYQEKMDEVFRSLGWNTDHWNTKFFKGENHSEISWAKRLDIPLLFLLRK